MSNDNRPAGTRRAFTLPTSAARLDAELQEEFRFHIEERIEQFVANGMSRAEAEAEVHRRFGDYESYRDATRQIDENTLRRKRRAEFTSTLAREFKRSARLLWRTPGFSLIAFITLALGIGATTAIFAVLDAVVLRPLPYKDAGELVSMLHPATVPGSGERKWGLSAGGYFEFRKHTRALTDMGMYRNYGFTVTNGGEAEMAQVAEVTASMFPTLQARASLGRLITASDDSVGKPNVAVLSHEFHKRRFGGDPSIIGKNLETSSGTREIIGVTEPGLTLPMPGPFASSANLAGFGVDVWVPMRLNPAGPFYNNHPYVGVGRLAAGKTVEDAQAEFTNVMATLPTVVSNAYSEEFIKNYNFRVEVAPLRNAVLGERVPKALWTLFGSVLLVLLIAAANVANLFLVRFEARRREAAVRTALGADRIHMAAHYFSETLLLCGVAAVAGIGLAQLALKAMLAIAPTDIPRLHQVSIGWSAMVVAFVVALLLGGMLGLLPLLRRGVDIETLRDQARTISSSPRQRRARSTLVVGQIALALVLLASAGLMIRCFELLRKVKPGFNADQVLVFSLSLPFTQYDTREKALAYHREISSRIGALPGVEAVGSSSSVPLEDYGTGCSVVFREKRAYAPGEQTPCVSTPSVAPGFFEAMHIPVEGRTPTWNDIDQRTQASVITRALADRLWPGEDPIGKGIGSNGPNSEVWYRVVGVVEDIRLEALELAPTEAIFNAATGLQPNVRSGAVNDFTYFVRTSGDPTSMVSAIRGVVAEYSPRVPFMEPRSMATVVERSMARTSFIMILLAIAAAVALTLSIVGIYGVISYVVTQRRGEIGIRMALGASVPSVVRMVVMQSVRLAVVGVAIGLLGALWTTKSMQALLYNVSPSDPLVLSTVAASLLTVAVVASAAPARKAARVDPVEAMRGE